MSRDGTALPPNVVWAEKHAGETLQLEYLDASYIVTVREATSSVADSSDGSASRITASKTKGEGESDA